ncbi:fumarylacetoacetase [Thiotrichales bacterium 19S9-12]|nr:fumarylacetoacetase [Thiotrichales bacterium 19S9-11]MCF6811756.1 fumarylacetoacetase [Thiotrichales bacterium 19S9-12]
MIEANNPNLTSFITVPNKHDFPIQNLPFGIFSDNQNPQKRIGVAIGDYVFDLYAGFMHKLFTDQSLDASLFNQPYLNDLMALERSKITELRNAISRLLRHDNFTIQQNQNLKNELLIPANEVTLHLPVKIGGYTDFYSSIEHASNIGKLFRDKDNPLLPNWRHMPVAYDGRAGSIVVSGTNFRRPLGQLKPNEDAPSYGACRGLDVEVEVGYFIGNSSTHGEQITTNNAPEHVFGMVLVNDWSARDIQKWEYVPLGPFLGKNFCTSISPWVITLDALEPFRTRSPEQSPEVLPYLKRHADWAVDLNLELALKTEDMVKPKTVAQMNFKSMYWDFTQQVAHHSVNGCPMQTGDLLASGTISGNSEDSYGSLIELTFGGKQAIKLDGQTERTFLKDGDTAIIKGYCQNESYRIGFGEVSGTVLPALDITTEKSTTKQAETA